MGNETITHFTQLCTQTYLYAMISLTSFSYYSFKSSAIKVFFLNCWSKIHSLYFVLIFVAEKKGNSMSLATAHAV